MGEEVEYIDLYRLQLAVKQGMAQLFPQAVWVKAEISSIGRRSNGHCYLELSQSEDSHIVAQVRAVIWRNTYPFLSQYFKKVTGQELAAGQEVLVHVKVGYHEVYGLSLTIDDINPEYTLGAHEALRKQTIERLEAEGLMDLQKELCLTDIPYYLAVISAQDAAGFGDFRRHLLENPAGYAYRVDLFEALMQGRGAPESICEALSRIGESSVPYDAVLILRGGGSDLDLACFDDYGLAAAVARFPVPVFTAIGHDRDFHVADMVANRFVKTPTALADLFLDCTAAEDERISSAETRLFVAFSSRLARAEDRLLQRAEYICKMALNTVERAEIKLTSVDMQISSADPRKVLDRGIPVVENRSGRKDTVAADYRPGDQVKVFLRGGKLDCVVQRVTLSERTDQGAALTA